MFDCVDSKGSQVHLEDVATLVEPSPKLLPVGAVVLVVNIYGEDEVKIMPEEAGVAEIVSPEILEIKSSWVSELTSLATNEDLQDLLTNAEARFNDRLSRQKETKAKKKTASAKAKPVVETVLDI